MVAPTSTRGKISVAGAEYNLTEHCNLSCYQCDHASPLLEKSFASLADFERDIQALAEVMHLGELRLLGGEPLLHPQLLKFVEVAHEIGIADEVAVYTNGILLHTMPDEFWRDIDALWVSTYPGVRRRMSDEAIAAKCAEHAVRLDMRPLAAEFSLTCVNNPVEDPGLVKSIFRECKTANEYGCFTIYEGMFFRCSVAPFTQKRLRLAGVEFPSPRVDGVPIHGNPRLREELNARLKSKEPMKACSYCLGTSGPMVSHHQVNRQGCKAWIKEDNREDIAFARENVRRQAFERRLHAAPRLIGRTARKGRRILASLVH